MEQILIRIIISMTAVIATGYIFFCMSLTLIARPNDESGRFKYQFQEEPKGFIKASRLIGHIVCIGLIVTLLTAISYIVLFC